MKRALQHLGPVIQNRLDQEMQYGPEWPGKPVRLPFNDSLGINSSSQNDLITWMLQTMTEEEKSGPNLIYDVSLGVLVAGLASIHTTSGVSLTSSLFPHVCVKRVRRYLVKRLSTWRGSPSMCQSYETR